MNRYELNKNYFNLSKALYPVFTIGRLVISLYQRCMLLVGYSQ